MSQFSLDSLNDVAKGILAIILGTILLFYTLGLLEKWVTTLFIMLSFGLIGYGLYLTGLVNLANKFIKKTDETDKQS